MASWDAGVNAARAVSISSLISDSFDAALQDDWNVCGQQVGDFLEGEN